MIAKHEEAPLDIDWEVAVGSAGAGVYELIPPVLVSKEPPTLTESILENRPTLDPIAVLSDIKARTQFTEAPHHRHLRIRKDLMGLRRRLKSGGHETYEDKLKKETDKGETESASLGLAQIGEHRVVMFATHPNFFAGSAGVVAGEKFQLAVDMASAESIPLVGIYTSAGARQQEGTAALDQLRRTVNAGINFKRNTKRPHIAVLNAQVWGGTSASNVPAADLIVALRGTDVGFAGPRVIETYTGSPVKPGKQSAEIHSIHRNADKLVANQVDLLNYLGRLLSVLEPDHPRLTKDNLPDFNPGINQDDLPFRKQTSKKFERTDEVEVFSAEPSLGEKLYQQYETLAHDAQRLDTKTLTQLVFSDVVELYDDYSFNEVMHYPAIIAALGKIGPQPFLIIGNQPSYQTLSDGSVRKIPSSPDVKDFLYMQRMLKFGGRIGLPVVFFTDTLGAKPTIEAEEQGQSRAIHDSIEAGIEYPNLEFSVITGVLGSGGGLATTPTGDYIAMFDDAMGYVSEPTSQTAILYNKANPSKEEIIESLPGMRATAQDQLDLGLIDAVIKTSNDPIETARNVFDAIANAFIKTDKPLRRRLLHRRNNRNRRLKGLEIENGHN